MRKSGILMHITSLPGPWGVGTMGKSAYEFIDFLAAAGQSLWQILPLNPTGYGDSPYQSCSTFAGNPYLIDFTPLIREGLLEENDLAGICWGSNENKVDFGKLWEHKTAVLRKAFARFRPDEGYDAFCRDNGSWLGDFALYMALKDATGSRAWFQWEEKLKFRDPDRLWAARQEYQENIRFYKFVQYIFQKQWSELLAYAHEKGVQVIGDVPIYVPMDSVDVWANPELFALDEALRPVEVAGCPPDAFSEDGQLWGNPLYRWDVHKEDGYVWWIRRLKAASERYDIVRIDHFRGLAGYWAVPAQDKTAKNGQWLPGPGLDFIQAVKQQLPQAKMIAEDLGFLTEDVYELLAASGYPGMKVLGFAFDSREPSEYLPYNCPKNSICYTGTHDNMTTRQWFETASADAVSYAKEFMVLTEAEGYTWGMIRSCMASPSDTAIVPLQDYLDLGGEARMNFPGATGDQNWTWRVSPGYDSPELAEKIRKLTKLYGRLGQNAECKMQNAE